MWKTRRVSTIRIVEISATFVATPQANAIQLGSALSSLNTVRINMTPFAAAQATRLETIALQLELEQTFGKRELAQMDHR